MSKPFVGRISVDIPEAGAQGVLFAHAVRFGGHALYVKDNRLHYVNDYPGTAPWEFTGGIIKRVAVDVCGEPYVDLEREAAGMMARE